MRIHFYRSLGNYKSFIYEDFSYIKLSNKFILFFLSELKFLEQQITKLVENSFKTNTVIFINLIKIFKKLVRNTQITVL